MTRKACHYAVLAAILLGVPAICAHLSGDSEIWEGVKSFPPRTEYCPGPSTFSARL